MVVFRWMRSSPLTSKNISWERSLQSHCYYCNGGLACGRKASRWYGCCLT
jgi:hypothetical protein